MNLYIRNFITVLIAFCCFSCDIKDNLGPEVIGGDQYSEGYLIDTFVLYLIIPQEVKFLPELFLEVQIQIQVLENIMIRYLEMLQLVLLEG